MKYSRILGILLCSAMGITNADNTCLEKAKTQSDLNICGSISYQDADKELNRVYSQIRVVYKNDKDFLEALKKSQMAWIKFRDAEYEARYPGENKQELYGSSLGLCAPLFLAEFTLKRVAELKQWLNGIEEGDICIGSVMFTPNIEEKLKELKN